MIFFSCHKNHVRRGIAVLSIPTTPAAKYVNINSFKVSIKNIKIMKSCRED